MRKIDIDAVKYQCRIDHSLEDELLESYIKAAYSYMESYLSASLHSYEVPDDVDNGMVITPSINQAALMLVAHWYTNREAVINNMVNVMETPLAVTALLHPLRRMGV